MATVKQSLPSIGLDVQCGRTIDRSMDFTDRESGKQVHLIRKAVQVQFEDAEGMPTIGVAVPIRDWDVDLSIFERKRVRFFVSEFSLSRDGACVLRFCGYDVLDNSAKK